MSSFDFVKGMSARCTLQRAIVCSLALLATTLASSPAIAKNQAPARVLEVAELQLAPGTDVPKDYVDAIQEKLVQKLAKTKAFGTVRKQSSQAVPTTDLQLTWTITRFEAGSRTKRILAGSGRLFGVGATRMVIHVQLLDSRTNILLLDRDVEGAMKGNSQNPLKVTDPFGGSKRITGIEADKIVKDLEKAVHDHSHND